MKQQTLVFAFLLLNVPLFAVDQVFLEPVQPISPTLKAVGGSSTANAAGYDALFANPASFADDTLSVTFLSLEGTALVPLSGLNQLFDARDSWSNLDLLQSGNPLLPTANSLLTKSGIGAEFSTGFGWVGKDLGLGFVYQGKQTAKGRNLLETKTVFDSTMMGVIGMAWPFELGLGTLQVGGTIRPMQKSYASASIDSVLKNMGNLDAYDMLTGFGLGLDLGIKWRYSEFQTGLAVRDASGTVFTFKQLKASEWLKGLPFPSGGSSKGSTLYRIPTVIGLGSVWTPEMGTMAAVFQPSLMVDFQIPIKDEFTQPSFWTWTHFGAQALLLRSVSVRAGLNQGYPTFGLGAKVSIVDFNLAVFADEMGRYSGSNRRSGLSLDWAFRM